MKTDVYNTEGKKARVVELPDSVFNVAWNDSLMHQVVIAMQANARTPVAHTKNRGDVRGGGKKPWQQKGTGRARHGSIRSPIWRGGGVTFGPRNDKSYAQKINKRMRAKALFMALSKKLKEKEVLFVDSLGMSEIKSASAKRLIDTLAKVNGFEGLKTKRNNCVLIATDTVDVNAVRSFSNFGNIEVDEVRNLNPVDVLMYKYLIITNPDGAVETLASRAQKKMPATLDSSAPLKLTTT